MQTRGLTINDRYRLLFAGGYNRHADLGTEFRSLSSSLENPVSWLINLLNGQESQSGVPVNDETSLRLSAVYACNRVLSDSIASLPINLYRSLPGGGSEIANRRPEQRLVAESPSPDYTSYTFRSTAQFHLGMRGNFYARIYRDGRGGARLLRILHPDTVRPFYHQGKLYYEINPNPAMGYDEPRAIFTPDDVLHIAGLGASGIIGKSPLEVLRDTIGIGLGNTQYVANIQKNGGRVRGYLVHPTGKLGAEQINELRDNFKTPLQRGDLPVLTGGLEYKSVSLSPADAEFINTAKLTTQDIARAYRVPPHMIGDLERATFSNIEHQSIQFVQQTLLPWLKNWEAELNRKLLPTDLQGEYYFRFKVEGMLRGDILSRYRAYAIARQWGWTNADEIRDLEDMNPLPDGQGQLYLTPMNMVPADMVEDQFQGDPNTDNNTNTTDDGNQNAGTAKKQPAAA